MARNERINPTGFENSSRETGYNVQNEQRTSDVNQIIRPDQMISKESTGKADSMPGPQR